MLQPRGRANLGEKTLSTERGTEVGMEDLDGDVAVVADVVREIDRRHAAGAELPIDAIAIGEGGGQSRKNVVVRHFDGDGGGDGRREQSTWRADSFGRK